MATTMLGGLALWKDTATLNTAATIKTGTLDVEAFGTPAWKDITVASTPKAFNPATDAIVPGDKIEQTTQFGVQALGLEKVDLRVEIPAITGDAVALPTDTKGIHLKYEITGTGITAPIVGDLPKAGLIKDINITSVPASLQNAANTEADYTVKIIADFDSRTTNRDYVEANTVLGQMKATVTQVN